MDYKSLLLLSVMDLISQGQITENFIEPSLELVDAFNTYYTRIMPLNEAPGRQATEYRWKRLR